MEFDKSCRTCMAKNKNFKSLFSKINLDNNQEMPVNMLQICTSLEVTPNDHFSKIICDSCLTRLINAYTFYHLCSETYTKLQILFNISKANSEQINEDTGNKIKDCDGKVVTEIISNNASLYEPKNNSKQINDEGREDIIQYFDDEADHGECDNSPSTEHTDIFMENENENILNCSHSNNDISVLVNTEKCSDKIEKLFSCPLCNRTFQTKYTMTRHKKVHSHNDNLRCKVCSKQFSRVTDVKRHMSSHTGIRPYKCVVCQSSFTQSGSLAKHLRKHKDFKSTAKQKKRVDKKPHLCTKCGKAFKHSSSLTIHMRRHDGEKPYVCSVCDMRFVSSGRLTSHSRVHTGEKPFECKICGKKFAHSSAKGKHLKTHSGVKPYRCDLCCKSFPTSYCLMIHMRHHTGEKPYKCDGCPKTFGDPKNLTQHRKIHSSDRPYLCMYCGKRFRRSHHLKNHNVIHNRE